MDLVSIFATVILVATIGTLIMAVAAYFAYKVREWRKPKLAARKKAAESAASGEPVFLKRYVPPPRQNNDRPVNG